MLILGASLAAYFGIPAVLGAFVRILARGRAHRERTQENLDELLRMGLLEIVERDHEECRNDSPVGDS